MALAMGLPPSLVLAAILGEWRLAGWVQMMGAIPGPDDLLIPSRQGKMRSRLILQIHDELLLEVPEDEAEAARTLVTEVMEGALDLVVPLVVDARLGKNWAEVH